jgi:polyisoprenoid-binding protein YceI
MISTLVRTLCFVIPAAAIIITSAHPPARAEAKAWTIDYQASRLSFSGRQAGVGFEGWFERFTADVRFDPAAPSNSRIEVVIDMGSATSDNRERDAAIRGRDWFAVADHPTARFQAASVRALDGNRYEANGTLTIRGISRPVGVPFSLEADDGGTRAQGEVSIVRTDYGVGQGSWSSGEMVGLDVAIRFNILARRSS